MQVCAVLISFTSTITFSLVTGYGDGPDTPARSSAASAETDSAPSTSRSGRKIRKTRKEDVSAEASNGGNIPSGGEHQDKVGKKAKKSRKKAVS